jgi:hypothetical protein
VVCLSLPIGGTVVTHGYSPPITELIYVNDDDQNPRGITLFDEIVDVTVDLPVAPTADILYTIESLKRITTELFHVTVQFYGRVFDPDSNVHTFAWDFGDSTFSLEQDPRHDFYVTADYTYTVDWSGRSGLAGNDTCQVRVTGTGSCAHRQLRGDIFTGRQYEEAEASSSSTASRRSSNRPSPSLGPQT